MNKHTPPKSIFIAAKPNICQSNRNTFERTTELPFNNLESSCGAGKKSRAFNPGQPHSQVMESAVDGMRFTVVANRIRVCTLMNTNNEIAIRHMMIIGCHGAKAQKATSGVSQTPSFKLKGCLFMDSLLCFWLVMTCVKFQPFERSAADLAALPWSMSEWPANHQRNSEKNCLPGFLPTHKPKTDFPTNSFWSGTSFRYESPYDELSAGKRTGND